MRLHLAKCTILCILFVGTLSCPFAFDDDTMTVGDADTEATHRRVRRDLTVDGTRPLCKESGGTDPPTSTDTRARIIALRALFTNSTYTQQGIDAYIIPMNDQHQGRSEFAARIRFISGYKGSSGTVVVTKTKQALWTDGRYFLAADQEMDCNWILMRSGEAGVPSITTWLKDEVPQNGTVGADPSLFRIDSWRSYKKTMEESDKTISFVPITTNLIDLIWTSDRPAQPANSLLILNMTYTGREWSNKVEELQSKMTSAGADALILSKLDENAWLFNLRGSDIAYNPVFFSYTIVKKTGNPMFYIMNKSGRLGQAGMMTHLNTGSDGSCTGKTGLCVEVRDYSAFISELQGMVASTNKFWVSPVQSYSIYNAIAGTDEANKGKVIEGASPVLLMKAIKNPVERQGMRNCQARDSSHVIEFVARLEREVKAGTAWTELQVVEELLKVRQRDPTNHGASFSTIAGFGPNGAVIHYRPSNQTNSPVTTQGTFLLDSGGQYLDGTTDVTRTFHFGTPDPKEIEAYTRVLMGAIDLATTVWPVGVYGRDIDVFARGPLYSVGLNYRHGTGHGLGTFLNVHEGPGRISLGYRETAYEQPLYEGQWYSDEPGYYEDGKFGIRLETIVEVANASTKYNFGNRQWLTFEAWTLVPFEKNMIDVSLLTASQRQWLNKYHKKCKEIVGPMLQNAGKKEAYDWLMARVDPIPETPRYETSSGKTWTISACVLILSIMTSWT